MAILAYVSLMKKKKKMMMGRAAKNHEASSGSSSRIRSHEENESRDEFVNVIGLEEEGEIASSPPNEAEVVPMHALDKDSTQSHSSKQSHKATPKE